MKYILIILTLATNLVYGSEWWEAYCENLQKTVPETINKEGTSLGSFDGEFLTIVGSKTRTDSNYKFGITIIHDPDDPIMNEYREIDETGFVMVIIIPDEGHANIELSEKIFKAKVTGENFAQEDIKCKLSKDGSARIIWYYGDKCDKTTLQKYIDTAKAILTKE